VSSRKNSVIRVRVSADDLQILKKLAERDGVTVSELVRRALRSLVDQGGGEEGGQAPSNPPNPSIHPTHRLDDTDIEAIYLADRLVARLATESRDIVTFDRIRSHLKAIKPAVWPFMEQNVVYMLQGLGLLEPVGSASLVTDPNRRVGVFRIRLSDEVLEKGVAWALNPNNGHEEINRKIYNRPVYTQMGSNVQKTL
jgi:hypothetical protein